MKHVVILGAGLSGLGCALQLPGASLFEAEDHPGGHAYSHPLGGISFDEGAHICHSKDPRWLDLVLKSAGDVVEVARSSVTNYWRGHWVTYPVQNHLVDLPVEARTRALADFVQAQAEHRGRSPANYREWCLFQYGQYLADNFYAEYTRKYWRVPMEELATDWLAGRLLPSQVERVLAGAAAPLVEEQPAFAAFRYPARGGFFAFVKPLFATLPVRYNSRAVLIDARRREVEFADGATESYEALAASLPLPEVVRMTRDAPPHLLEAASRLRCLRLLCVNLVIAKPGLTNAHWFYLYDNDIEPARVSVVSNLAPASAPPGTTVLQAEVFRRADEPEPDAAVIENTLASLGRVLGFAPGDVKAVHPVTVPRAYVISDHARAAAAGAIVEWLESRDIFPMGLFGKWKFIWSDAAFRSGEETALRIRAGG